MLAACVRPIECMPMRAREVHVYMYIYTMRPAVCGSVARGPCGGGAPFQLLYVVHQIPACYQRMQAIQHCVVHTPVPLQRARRSLSSVTSGMPRAASIAAVVIVTELLLCWRQDGRCIYTNIYICCTQLFLGGPPRGWDLFLHAWRLACLLANASSKLYFASSAPASVTQS